MAVYEVRTEDLFDLEGQLATQADQVGSTRSGVAEATEIMLQQMETSLSQAVMTIDALLEELSGSVASAATTAGAADWLGPDADAFRAANGDLIAAIERSRSRLQLAVTDHRVAATQIGAALQTTLQQFSTEADRSQQLSGQLSGVVGVEADNYEQAFNGSWNGAPSEIAGVAGPSAGVGGSASARGWAPAAGDGADENDWDGIGDPDREWHQGPEWESKYRNGTGEDPSDPPIGIDPLAEHTFLDAEASAEAGVLEGSFGTDAGLHGAGELAAAKADAQVDAKAGLSLTEGAFVSASAGASAVLGAAEGKIGYGPVTAQGQAYALGAEASADVKAGIGPDGARATFNSEAFVGGKAEGEISGSYAGVTAGVGGEVSYGVGAHANADASFTTERVGVSVDVGASLGLGAGVKFDVSVDPTEVVDFLGDLF